MAKIILKQGEAKTLTLTVTDQSGVAVDLSGATLLLGVKKDKGEVAYIVSKLDAAFTKTLAELGVVTVNLSATDTNQPEGTYTGELRCAWGDGAVTEKSADFYLQIRRAVTA